MALLRKPSGNLTAEQRAKCEAELRERVLDKKQYDQWRAAGVWTWREVKDELEKRLKESGQ